MEGDGDSKIVLRGSIPSAISASTMNELSDTDTTHAQFRALDEEEDHQDDHHLDHHLDHHVDHHVDHVDQSLVIANQPRPSSRKTAGASFHSPFDDAHSERAWSSPLYACGARDRSCIAMSCCWPMYRYNLATRVGETPFMPLIPCAAFALRIKIRTLFGIKGSLIDDFFTTLCCEPCSVCQMVREMDNIGL